MNINHSENPLSDPNFRWLIGINAVIGYAIGYEIGEGFGSKPKTTITGKEDGVIGGLIGASTGALLAFGIIQYFS